LQGFNSSNPTYFAVHGWREKYENLGWMEVSTIHDDLCSSTSLESCKQIELISCGSIHKSVIIIIIVKREEREWLIERGVEPLATGEAGHGAEGGTVEGAVAK
jgi:hypothetical protein